MDQNQLPRQTPASEDATLPSGTASKLADKTETLPRTKTAAVSSFHEEPDLSGMTLGGYRLVRKLAEGGMGVVYEAIQTKLDRKVALKVLTQQLSSMPEFLKRFEREAKAAAALSHPHLVQVHDFGETDGRAFMVMEFVEGEDLSAYVENHGKLSVLDALNAVEQAARALKSALDKSIIHRDIKPSNLMYTREGIVKVSDLGLAKVLNQDAEMTATGVGIGSPYFIAPEQAADASSVDHKADIYSLGITLLYLLTGRKPFEGGTPYSIVLSHVNKPLPKGSELGTELPREVEKLIERMAAKDPEDRYQDYDSLLSDLQRVKAGHQPIIVPASQANKSSRKPVAIGVAALLLMLTIAVSFLLRTRSQEEPAGPASSAVSSEPVPVIESSSRATVAVGTDAPQFVELNNERPAFRPSPESREEDFRERGPGGGPERRGSRQRLLPMGPPAMMEPIRLSPGTPEEMIKQADEAAAANGSNYTMLIDMYRQLRRRVAGTPLEAEVGRRITNLEQRHMKEAEEAIALFTSKMQEHLKAGNNEAAFYSWAEFPSRLRSWEVDNKIEEVLRESLPANFSAPPR